MQQFHTEREQRFIDLAATLADDFATRAAQHDAEGSFPHENYERLKETGYSVLTIPEELGGMGASLLERMKAQERLAQGCGPTALAINMHFNVMSLLINLWQRSRTPPAEAMLRQIVAERLIVGGSGSEPDNAVSILRPRTTAERVDGGWRVSGRKIFSTQSIALDRYFAEATCKEGIHAGQQTGTIISFLIPRDTPGFIIKDDWHTMGMRSTESRSTELKDAFVPESAVFLQRPVFARGGITSLFPRAPFTIGSVYIGIATAARNFVVEFMRDRPRFPLTKPMSHLPSVYNKVGEPLCGKPLPRLTRKPHAPGFAKVWPPGWSLWRIPLAWLTSPCGPWEEPHTLNAFPWNAIIAMCGPACSILLTAMKPWNSSVRRPSV